MSPILVGPIEVQRFLIVDIPKVPSTELGDSEKSLSIIVYGNKCIAVLQLEYII